MKIYIVVDAQNDFIDGVLGTKEAQAAVPRIVNYLNENVTDNDFVFFTRDTHWEAYMNTMEGHYLPVPHCIEGTSGHNVNEDIVNVVKDKSYNSGSFIDKPVFGSMDLLKDIKKLNLIYYNIDEIILMGFCTDICVISNALLLKAEPDISFTIPIKVKEDCCAGVTPEKHAAAIEVMKSCQIEII